MAPCFRNIDCCELIFNIHSDLLKNFITHQLHFSLLFCYQIFLDLLLTTCYFWWGSPSTNICGPTLEWEAEPLLFDILANPSSLHTWSLPYKLTCSTPLKAHDRSTQQITCYLQLFFLISSKDGQRRMRAILA